MARPFTWSINSSCRGISCNRRSMANSPARPSKEPTKPPSRVLMTQWIKEPGKLLRNSPRLIQQHGERAFRIFLESFPALIRTEVIRLTFVVELVHRAGIHRHRADGAFHTVRTALGICDVGCAANILPSFALILEPVSGILRHLPSVISLHHMK